MPQLEYFVVCRTVSMDLASDEINLLNVIEDVWLEADGPTLVPQIYAVSSWHLSSGDNTNDNQVALRVVMPGGDRNGFIFPANIADGRNRFRAIIGLAGIPIERPGVLLFELLLNGAHAASHRVNVHAANSRLEGTPEFAAAETSSLPAPE